MEEKSKCQYIPHQVLKRGTHHDILANHFMDCCVKCSHTVSLLAAVYCRYCNSHCITGMLYSKYCTVMYSGSKDHNITALCNFLSFQPTEPDKVHRLMFAGCVILRVLLPAICRVCKENICLCSTLHINYCNGGAPLTIDTVVLPEPRTTAYIFVLLCVIQ